LSFTQFQDRHGAARLRGTERPWMLSLVHDVTAGVLLGNRAAGEHAGALHDLLPRNHELRELPAPRGRHTLGWQAQYVRATQSIFDNPVVTYRGKDLELPAMLLNTAMAVGSDAVKLAARLYGQCEINCWVDGSHRAWLASVIQSGLDAGLYRPNLGWEDVRKLLLARDDCPVVVSLGEAFPASWMSRGAGAGGPDAEEEWETLPAEEQWRLGLQTIHARSVYQLEIRPDWAPYRFGHNLSFLDLLAEDRDARMDHALGLSPAQEEPAPQ
jgi:hypothetical protein